MEIKSPIKAIRAFCRHDCMAGQVKAVRECKSTDCALWNFRMGTNPFRYAKKRAFQSIFSAYFDTWKDAVKPKS